MEKTADTTHFTRQGSWSRRAAPHFGVLAALLAGLLVRTALEFMGWAESRDIFDYIRVLGVMTLSATASWWAGRITRQLVSAAALGALAGMAGGCFAHEPVPALIGLVILGFLGLRMGFAVVRYAMVYAFAVLYGGGLGAGAHYLTYDRMEPLDYAQGGLLALGGLGLAYLILRAGLEEGDGTRRGRFRAAMSRLHGTLLLLVIAGGIGGSLYALQGQSLEDFVGNLRKPIEEEIEQRVDEWEATKDQLDAAQRFKDGVDRLLDKPDAEP